MINFVDILVLLILWFSILLNSRRGTLAVAETLIALIVALLLSSAIYQTIGRWLTDHLGFELPIANILAYGTVLVAIYVGVWLLLKHFIKKPTPKFEESRLSRAGGVLLGFVAAFLITSGILAIASDLPLSRAFKDQLYNSGLAKPLIATGKNMQDIIDLTPNRDIAKTINLLTIQPTSYESVNLKYKTRDVKPRPDLEFKMVVFVNKERAARHLKKLTIDEDLTAVARAHSTDMFARGYFSHRDPDGLDPFARLAKAHIDYKIAGENIALSSTLELAHEGLMNSPTHKANILKPEYTTIGIGIIDGGEHGLMISQVFKK